MNCLLYARVSTDRQARKDLSIPAQLAAMREHARQNKWRVTGDFVDEGQSARTADRPQLQQLIRRCKEGGDVDVVLIHKIDRLARNLVDYATIKAILKQRGIRLVSVSEPFDDSSVGQLLENIIASISQWYSANLGDEIRKAYRAKLLRGEWPHKPPLGYKSERGEGGRAKTVPDGAKAPLVRQAFELYATGSYSLQGVADEMRGRGLVTRYGRTYSPELIRKLLRRPFYCGRMIWLGHEYEGQHEPLISRALFHRVQDVLVGRGADTGEKGRLQFLLRGVAYCRVCGQRLTAEVHPRGSYYRCVPSPHRPKCDQPYPPVAALDAQLEALYQRLQPAAGVLKLLRHEMGEIASRRERIAQTELGGLRHRIEDLENRRLRLLDERVAGRVSADLYEKMERRYVDSRRAAEARLEQLTVDYDDPLDLLDKAIVVASTLSFLHQRFDLAHRKELLRAVFAKLYVEDKIIVGAELNPPFSFLLRDDVDGLFEHPDLKLTQEDVFEQLARFTLSELYREAHERLTSLLTRAGAPARAARQSLTHRL